jgi:branched-chain amino acid transport system substrate-binding protein
VRKRGLLVLTLALLVLGLMGVMFLSACGEEETTTTAAPASSETTAPASTETTATTAPASTETTAATGEAGEDLVIGSINSLTGSNVLTGEEEKWAQEKAVADINAKGGVKLADGKMHKLVLKFVDDKSQPTEAAAAMEKLIKSDNIKVVLSSNITPVNQAAATVAEQYGAYFDIVSSWTDEARPDGSFPGYIGGMDLKWSTDMFESAGDSGIVAVEGAKAMENQADIPKNWAVMTENTPDGVGFGDATKARLEAEGWNVVAYEKFVEGNKDFSSIILKFKDAGVEGVVTLIAPSDGITFVKQMKEQNWAPKYLFGFKGFWPVNFYRSLGSDADYVCFDAFWGETLPYPYCKELGEAFTAEHDGATSVSIGLYYAGVQILAAAIERAGVFEPGAIRDQVFNGSFPGTTMGDIKYNDQGIADIPFLAYQWASGEKRVLLYPTEFATGKTVTFVPWEQR